MGKLPKSAWMCAGLAVVLILTYANHFGNGFHFDDAHTVSGNPAIRSLSNVPRFFVDPVLFSTMPDHQVYRPVTMVTLAVDYWFGGGLKPFWFHLSTFVWLVVQVTLMFFLFRRIMDAAHPHPSNQWTALFAAAWYGVHPAIAETVNYVIQRADLLSTAGIVASVWIFARYPERRRQGWYLIPAVLATFAKTPALIFPAILIAYVVLIERPGRWAVALAAAVPGIVVSIISAAIQARMTPPGFNAGAASGLMYRITQPYVTLYYFKSFFLPTELSADTDWGYVPGVLSSQAVIGYLFLAGLVWAIVRASRTNEARPIAFGLAWFLLGLAPTAMMPLAEVMNDHRMYLPFVGLVLAVVWALRLALFRRTVQLTRPIAAGAVAVLLVFAAGTYARNKVWRDDESLWRDVVAKSPNNGRGLMNYGLIFMQRGDYQTAVSYFERAVPLTPNYWTLETNLGVAYGGLRRDAEAEQHFLRAATLAPTFSEPRFFYGRWLDRVGRTGEAAAELEAALKINPRAMDARDLLIGVYGRLGNWTARERVAQETLRLEPGDDAAKSALTQSADRMVQPVATPQPNTAEQWLDASHQFYSAGRYEESIAAAKKALALRPEYAEAYNNIAAANNALHRWNEGIWAAMQAVRIQPDNQLARNNLAWGMKQKTRSQAK